MSRRKARELALQILFQLDFNDAAVEDVLQDSLGEQAKLNDNTRDYVSAVVRGTRENLAAIDEIIGVNSHEWKVSRMAGIDRNIARLAVYEMEFAAEKLEPKIIINEAVELAKTFGADDSQRFVNGVLGGYVKRRAAAGKELKQE